MGYSRLAENISDLDILQEFSSGVLHLDDKIQLLYPIK
jgi:hypothetical protein